MKKYKIPISQLGFLYSPNEWYEELRSMISSARHRIVLAALYIGGGELEKKLLQELSDAIKARPSLQVSILVDGLRGTRGKPTSLQLLGPLVQANRHTREGERVRVSVHEASNLRGWQRKLVPARYNEAFGVQHMKVAVSDDRLLLTGANLSSDYFTTRQDRYVWINHGGLSDLYTRFVSTVSDHGSVLTADQGRLRRNGPDLQTATTDEIEAHTRRMADALQSLLLHGGSAGDATTAACHDDVDPMACVSATPTLQFSQGNIYADSKLTEAFLQRGVTTAGEFHLASAYLNLTERYQSLLSDAALRNPLTRVILSTAAPEANGFFNAPGAAKYIVHAYTLLEREMMARLASSGLDAETQTQLREYSRAGWTFHCKGAWLLPADLAEPSATLIGSSNFGVRSQIRDLESQLLLESSHPSFRASLQSEISQLEAHTRPIHAAALAQRNVAFWVPRALRILRPLF